MKTVRELPFVNSSLSCVVTFYSIELSHVFLANGKDGFYYLW